MRIRMYQLVRHVGRSPSTGISTAAAMLALLSLAAGTALAISSGKALTRRARCSPSPQVAAEFVIPPAPFRARVVSVRRTALPPGEPAGRGPRFKRLYRVTFVAVKGNAVLPAGHRYTQFAYVTRKTGSAPWCFLKGGSGP
jgi:hypothetical protein